MRRLTIDFQEGFTGQAVEVLVEGRVVFRKPGLATARILGLADRWTGEIPDRAVEIVVQTKGPELKASWTQLPETPGNVGVNLRGDRLVQTMSREEFGYA